MPDFTKRNFHVLFKIIFMTLFKHFAISFHNQRYSSYLAFSEITPDKSYISDSLKRARAYFSLNHADDSDYLLFGNARCEDASGNEMEQSRAATLLILNYSLLELHELLSRVADALELHTTMVYEHIMRGLFASQIRPTLETRERVVQRDFFPYHRPFN